MSDGLDGWLARKLDSATRYGAIVDPLADKALLVSAYISFAWVGILPWWVAAVVLARDIVIVSGALAFHSLFGSYDMDPSRWGKTSTFVQIVFAVMLLAAQVSPLVPMLVLQSVQWLVVVLAFVSGGHYVYIWGAKAAAGAQS